MHHYPVSGVWELRLIVSDRVDSGVYSCKTNSAAQARREEVELVVVESRASISGPRERFLTHGSNLLLHCTLELGIGPNIHYKKLAVLHWFQDQRLLDTELQGRGSRKSQIKTHVSISRKLEGWLSITHRTNEHSGNYSCVPSYAVPAWTVVHIIPGALFHSQDLQIIKVVSC